MKIVVIVLGAIGFLLGGLWLLQGIGAVQIRPILCFADCDPVQEPSLTWTLIGAVFLAAGGLALVWAIRRLPGRRP